MTDFKVYYSNNGISCPLCYKNIGFNQKSLYVCHSSNKDPVSQYSDLSKISCSICHTNMKEIYNRVNKFRLYSCKEEDLDFCQNCYSGRCYNDNSNNFREIIYPEDRSVGDKQYHSWFSVFRSLSCDGCHRRFHDIFMDSTKPLYETSCSSRGDINMTDMASRSAGINRNRSVDSDYDGTFMAASSSGVTRGMFVTMMAARSSGRQNRSTDMTYMAARSSGIINNRNNLNNIYNDALIEGDNELEGYQTDSSFHP